MLRCGAGVARSQQPLRLAQLAPWVIPAHDHIIRGRLVPLNSLSGRGTLELCKAAEAAGRAACHLVARH